jgi:hypothetical protein
MTPEQLMEIPGIGEKMVDKIYQSVNRFYEGGETAAAETVVVSPEDAVEAEGVAEAAGSAEATELEAPMEPSATDTAVRDSDEGESRTSGAETNEAGGVSHEVTSPESHPETSDETASHAEGEAESGNEHKQNDEQREEGKS